MYVDGISCCGVGEIDGLGDCEDAAHAMSSLLRDNGVPRQPFVIFTQATSRANVTSYGNRFRAYILKHKLGTVLASAGKVNPNSGNHVKVFLWTVHKGNMQKYFTKLTAADAKKARGA